MRIGAQAFYVNVQNEDTFANMFKDWKVGLADQTE